MKTTLRRPTILKLPVNTELARVRGVVGYNPPKWLTGIKYRDTEKSVVVEILDSETGKIDVTIEARKLVRLSDSRKKKLLPYGQRKQPHVPERKAIGRITLPARH